MNKKEYYIGIAEATAKMSKCNRLNVGCVIVQDGVIIGTGFNGMARGEGDCGCNVEFTCSETIHAENNAIINCARIGVSTVGAVLFCTDKPCDNCSRIIINAGIKKVFYKNHYEGKGNIRLEDYVSVEKI